ncbi:hypothetical protein SAMN06264364_10130 [Quadrisphaera granulorum]|uniref:Uncharacterized protein n=1 Tax=Quadrisphaera granulorum TaxID=317664 RepID=A0A316AE49_9ACTN|nr:hypothetical protein [Quadrisphaera granulorum]PWJ56056.1 hypothetical protein BXY45_10130 [Quadrisphaera granulorum]SZE94690.1 hypothetical protein SAMN06264364_10130 [Quadrisphaera granulorum]
MSASTTLRRGQRIVVAAVGLGLAAATLAPAASAATSQPAGKIYVQPTCTKGSYNCNTPGNPKPTTPTTPIASGGGYSQIIKAPVKWYIGKAPGNKGFVIGVAAKGYRVIYWLFR